MVDVGSDKSSVGLEWGSALVIGNVWLLGLLEFTSVGEIRDWLDGVNGLSVSSVDVGEKEAVVSSEMVLRECEC
jgi:hypothetical protein